jgi:hypothetical protein
MDVHSVATNQCPPVAVPRDCRVTRIRRVARCFVSHAAQPQIIIPASLAITRQLAFWPREFNKVGPAGPAHICAGAEWAHPAHITPTSRRDWARPAHITLGLGSSRPHHAGTGLILPTSAPGLGPPRPHLRWDWARPSRVCTVTLGPSGAVPGGGGPPVQDLKRRRRSAEHRWNL